MYFIFTNSYSPNRIDEIVAYLLGPRLWIPQVDYPDFDDWVQRAWRELKSGRKRAMLCCEHGTVAGVLLYQRHKQRSDALELKNLTVRPDVRGRYIASFLLRNTEIEGAREFQSSAIVADAKYQNIPIRRFLMRNGYKIAEKTDLYQRGGGTDAVYLKKSPSISRFSFT